jgi:hypothetical protein
MQAFHGKGKKRLRIWLVTPSRLRLGASDHSPSISVIA